MNSLRSKVFDFRKYTKGYVDVKLAVLFMLIGFANNIRIPCLTMINAAGHFKETQWRAILEAVINITVCSEANRNRRLDYHDCFRVILNHQLDNRFNRRSIKEILLAVVVSALKFVRRSCSTVVYKAHLLPYEATSPLFQA